MTRILTKPLINKELNRQLQPPSDEWIHSVRAENEELFDRWFSIKNYNAKSSFDSPINSLLKELDFSCTQSDHRFSYQPWGEKQIDLSPIKRKVIPLIEYGFDIVDHVTFHGSYGDGVKISTGFHSGEVKNNPDPLFKLIEADLRFNINGRFFCLGYHNPYYYNKYHQYIGYVYGLQFFAYHPNDKDNPILKDIWVDVYK